MKIWNMVSLEQHFTGRCNMKSKDGLNVLSFEDENYRSEFRAAARERLRDYVESITTPAPRFGGNAFVCPCCKSGTGNNGKYTPAFFLFRTKAGELHFKCHACDITGDIFKLVGLVNHKVRFEDSEKIVAEFLGVDLSRHDSLASIGATDARTAQPLSQKETLRLRKEASAYIIQCRKDVNLTDYFYKRGFTDETIERFRLGYDSVKQQVVIPFSSTYYVTRSTQVEADHKGVRKHRKPAGLRQPLFNLSALSDLREPVFLTEAPMDAMSIVQAGGKAIALGGTSTALLMKVLGIYRPRNVFILAFDNDEPGNRLKEKTGQLLEERGVPYCLPRHPAFLDFKDANATLMANPELLAEGVSTEKQHACELIEETQLDKSAPHEINRPFQGKIETDR